MMRKTLSLNRAVTTILSPRSRSCNGSSARGPSLIRVSAAAAAAKSLQLCPTLCDPIDGSPPASPIPGILQARTLEWVAISFFNAWKWKVKVKSLSRVQLFATPWTAAYQAPPSMGFSQQGYWSGVPWPSLDHGISMPYIPMCCSITNTEETTNPLILLY